MMFGSIGVFGLYTLGLLSAGFLLGFFVACTLILGQVAAPAKLEEER